MRRSVIPTPDLVVITPSRGRPANAARLIKAITETGTADTELHIIVDVDDPELDGYRRLDLPVFAHMSVQRQRGLNAITNAYATVAAESCLVVGSLGDDHLPQTLGWDQRVLEALADKPGVAYGDDLLQGSRLPTAGFVSSSLIRCLGFMAPPQLDHMCVDDFWLALGHATSLHYLPDVIIEHLHPHAGKAPTDALYEAVNAPDALAKDQAAFGAYLAIGWPTDLERLRAAGLTN